jgi:hypothetical protein
LENLHVNRLHRQFCLRCLVAERVHNNCHEKVKEDLYTENDEADEKDVCDRGIAALVGHEAVRLVLLILHFRDALERDLIAAAEIEHQRVPALACCASEQKQERVKEVSEVCVIISVGLVGNIRIAELTHANDSVHEHQQQKEHTKRGHRWDRLK